MGDAPARSKGAFLASFLGSILGCVLVSLLSAGSTQSTSRTQVEVVVPAAAAGTKAQSQVLQAVTPTAAPPLSGCVSELCNGTVGMASIYGPNLMLALSHAEANAPSAYFKELTAALLAAGVTAAAVPRQPHTCLVQGAQVSIYPISFSIPLSMFEAVVPAKGQDFATVIPGLPSTYRFKLDRSASTTAILAAEPAYHADMARSLFAITYKKAGWDCMRHLEIIAAGALPIFTDIAHIPSGTMAAYPVEVLKLLAKWPGVRVQGVPGTPPGPGGHKVGDYINGEVVCELTEPINKNMYQLTTQAMLGYGRNVLSTAAMARYLLAVIGAEPHHRMLYIGNGAGDAINDYQQDTILHGLQSVMETPVTDWPRTAGVYQTPETFTEAQQAVSKVSRYGSGFAYAYKMHEPFGIDRSESRIRNSAEHFDFAIFGVAHRQWWRSQNIACGMLPKHRVAFIWGGDANEPPSPSLMKDMHACSDFIFIREMPEGCVPRA